MVRICKGLYINPLTAALFVVCYLNSKSAFFIISYISMLLHELAHLMAAYFVGLEPSHITLHPFGINLRLKNTIVCTVLDDIILYLSGPCMNLILALLFITVYKGRYLYDYGFAVNIMLFVVNMLPVCPLDGGSIIKKILEEVAGEDIACKIMNCVSGIISLLVFALGVYIIIKTGYNYSCIFISVLLFANIFTSKEKYSKAALKNMVFKKRLKKHKSDVPVKMFVTQENLLPAKYIKYMRPGVYVCVASVDETGKLYKIYTEEELLTMIKKT